MIESAGGVHPRSQSGFPKPRFRLSLERSYKNTEFLSATA
jgi:hypothetical protein